MPTRSELFLLDTSACVPFLLRHHPSHPEVFSALRNRRLTLAGHAAFETYSVLTRLPEPLRHDRATAADLIERNFPDIPFLSAQRQQRVIADLARAGVEGGAVYDGLIGAVAADLDLTLITGDRRAMTTYAVLGASVELIAGR